MSNFSKRTPKKIANELEKDGFLLPKNIRDILKNIAPRLLKAETENRKKEIEETLRGVEESEKGENEEVQKGELTREEADKNQRQRREWMQQFINKKQKEIEEFAQGRRGLLLDSHFRINEEDVELQAVLKTLQEKNEQQENYLEKNKVYINSKGEVFAWSLLGGGATADVYLAQNCETGIWKCMKSINEPKEISEARDILEATEIEIDVLRQEGMFGFQEDITGAQIVDMQLIHGEDLFNFIDTREGPVSFEQALAMDISIVEALESLQRNKWVHRDVKLENMIYDPERRQCFMIDFGSATKIGEEQKKGKPPGTAAYVTPEVVAGNKANIADDIYALGLVAARVLSAALPRAFFSEEDWLAIPDKLNELDSERGAYIASIHEEFLQRHAREEIDDEFLDKTLQYGNPAWEPHQPIWSVACGAKEPAYREQLSPEQKALCELLYDLTGPLSKRQETSLNDILEKMRAIRSQYIERTFNTKRHLYPDATIELFEKRNELKN